jgi:hypothetical protein
MIDDDNNHIDNDDDNIPVTTSTGRLVILIDTDLLATDEVFIGEKA